MHFGAKLYKGRDDGPLIIRENLDGQVFVIINAADRILLNGKAVGSHRFDLDRVQLAGRQVQGRFGRRCVGFVHLLPPTYWRR